MNVNDPNRIFFIGIFLTIVRIVQQSLIEDISFFEVKWILLGDWLSNGYLMYKETYDYTGPFAALIYKYFSLLFGNTTLPHTIFSGILILIQAYLFNGILIFQNIFKERSYVAAFFYVLFSCCVPDFMSLSPQLMSITFIYLATYQIVIFSKKKHHLKIVVLLCSLYLVIAFLICFHTILFYLTIGLIIIIFFPGKSRLLVLLIFNSLVLITFFCGYLYFQGTLHYFKDFYILKGISGYNYSLYTLNDFIVFSFSFISIFALVFLGSFTRIQINNYNKIIQRIIFIIALTGMLTIVWSNEFFGLILIFFVPLIAYYTTHFVLLPKRSFMKIIIPYFIVIVMLGYNFYSYKHFFKNISVDLKEYLHEDKRLILNNPSHKNKWGNLKKNSPCFDVELTAYALNTGLDYYNKSLDILHWMERLKPTEIQDDLNVIPKIFYRFPHLEKRYHLTRKNIYEIKTSN